MSLLYFSSVTWDFLFHWTVISLREAGIGPVYVIFLLPGLMSTLNVSDLLKILKDLKWKINSFLTYKELFVVYGTSNKLTKNTGIYNLKDLDKIIYIFFQKYMIPWIQIIWSLGLVS